MPEDIAIDRDHAAVFVRDSAGVNLPFSKGLMATSLLATGMATTEAYRIATVIEKELDRNRATEIDAQELADLAARTIEAMLGEELASRYRSWRRAKNTGRPVVLCLGGAPGVGKSTLATRLALRLGIHRVVPTDAIREVLRTVIPNAVLPELHVSTFERLENDTGEGAPTTVFLRQARAVSAASAAVAKRLVAEGRSLILEGVHLLPGDIRDRLADSEAIVVELLLCLDEEEVHRAHLLHRARKEPTRNGQRHVENLLTIRLLQEELRRLAITAGVPQHDVAHVETLTQLLVDRVVTAVDGEPPRSGVIV